MISIPFDLEDSAGGGEGGSVEKQLTEAAAQAEARGAPVKVIGPLGRCSTDGEEIGNARYLPLPLPRRFS